MSARSLPAWSSSRPIRFSSTFGSAPGLAPRDRSLVTVSSLIASGQSAQITYHLNRAMNNGLTAEETGELVAHAAFYAGWPNAFSASTVVGEVLRSRSK